MFSCGPILSTVCLPWPLHTTRGNQSSTVEWFFRFPRSHWNSRRTKERGRGRFVAIYRGPAANPATEVRVGEKKPTGSRNGKLIRIAQLDWHELPIFGVKLRSRSSQIRLEPLKMDIETRLEDDDEWPRCDVNTVDGCALVIFVDF